MTAVERSAGDFVVDAALLADAFGLSQEEIKARMRAGLITSRCEAGTDDGAGRWRLTFHQGDRAQAHCRPRRQPPYKGDVPHQDQTAGTRSAKWNHSQDDFTTRAHA